MCGVLRSTVPSEVIVGMGVVLIGSVGGWELECRHTCPVRLGDGRWLWACLLPILCNRSWSAHQAMAGGWCYARSLQW